MRPDSVHREGVLGQDDVVVQLGGVERRSLERKTGARVRVARSAK